MKKIVWLGGLLLVLLAVGGYAGWRFVASPNYSLVKMRSAVEQHDAEAFEKYVDIEGILRRSGNQIASEWTSDITKRISREMGLEADMVNGITSAFGSSLLEGTVKQMREAILSYIETGKTVNIQALPADVIDMATDIKVASLPEVTQSGKIANITVPLLVNGEPVYVRLYMRNKGMYWQVVEIENVGKTAQDILAAYALGERKRFETARAANPDKITPLPGLSDYAIPLTMCYIPAGKFMMGSPPNEDDRDEDEGPRHKVKITQGFWIGKYEVTAEQFSAFVNATNYTTSAEKAGISYGVKADGTYDLISGLNWRNAGFPTGEDHPAVHVSHDDATAFCEWLGRETGETWLLPSEAQWEYACRAGTSTAFFWGESAGAGKDYLNGADWTAQAQRFRDWDRKLLFPFEDRNVYTSSVGAFRPNGWGLYDMSGNVLEWCRDWYDADYYASGPVTDPLNENTSGTRLLPGGSWNNNPWHCRSANRGRTSPTNTYGLGGFRVVRASPR